MVIIELLRTAWSFLGKKTNLLGSTGVPIIVWMLAAYGAYSLALDSKDTVLGLVGMDSTSVTVRDRTKDVLNKAANEQLAATLEVTSKNNENAIRAITEASSETEMVNGGLDDLLNERDRLVKDLLDEQTTESGIVLLPQEGRSPAIKYQLDLKDNTEKPVVVKSEEPAVVTDTKPVTTKAANVVIKREPKTRSLTMRNPDIGTYSKKYDSGSAKINIRTLWSAYHIASNATNGIST